MTSAIPYPYDRIPTPKQTPGKEISFFSDRNDQGVAELEQVIAWDGLGGIRDAFDYKGSRLNYPGAEQDTETDAIAFAGDVLYDALIADQSALLFSVERFGGIMVEPINSVGGASAAYVWADPLTIDSMFVVDDVDGLEIWGDDQVDDADRYSIAGDPFAEISPGVTKKVAVWAFNAPLSSSHHILTEELAIAIDKQFGYDGSGPLFGRLVEEMDVDAIMTQGSADGANRLIFSIVPIDLLPNTPAGAPPLPTFDGGEIFVYEPGAATYFLNHGGHEWNTAFDVMGTFNLPSENINAIEAISYVPEPSSLVLAILGLAGLIGLRLRRKR